MPAVTRRAFVAASSAGLLAPAAGVTAAPVVIARIDGGLPPGFPTEDPDTVRTVVGKSHTDYETVHGLVTDRPELAKAVWDWGFGDWEAALGAASHMGRRDIAELLIAHGARPNLFTFAMLGQVDVVRAVCEANPGIQRTRGPHGITLLAHARRGGAEASSVVDYLQSLGGADEGQTNLPLDEAAARVYLGDYAPRGVDDALFHVGYHERRGGITFARDDRTFRFLMHRGSHEFSPGGAASVVIAFTVREGRATRLTVRDGEMTLVADRVA